MSFIYPADILASMKRVEATRSARIGKQFPRLTPEARQEALRKYHPDYIENAFRPIKVGVNRGGKTLHELAAALEGRPRVQPDMVDLEHPIADCDVLVIGGGGAGASAALLAQEAGTRGTVETKLR